MQRGGHVDEIDAQGVIRISKSPATTRAGLSIEESLGMPSKLNLRLDRDGATFGPVQKAGLAGAVQNTR